MYVFWYEYEGKEWFDYLQDDLLVVHCIVLSLQMENTTSTNVRASGFGIISKVEMLYDRSHIEIKTQWWKKKNISGQNEMIHYPSALLKLT